MFRLIDDRCVHLVRKWVERRLENVCTKKRLIIREIEKKKEYSTIQNDLEIPKQVVGNNILLLVIVKG